MLREMAGSRSTTYRSSSSSTETQGGKGSRPGKHKGALVKRSMVPSLVLAGVHVRMTEPTPQHGLWKGKEVLSNGAAATLGRGAEAGRGCHLQHTGLGWHRVTISALAAIVQLLSTSDRDSLTRAQLQLFTPLKDSQSWLRWSMLLHLTCAVLLCPWGLTVGTHRTAAASSSSSDISYNMYPQKTARRGPLFASGSTMHVHCLLEHLPEPGGGENQDSDHYTRLVPPAATSWLCNRP